MFKKELKIGLKKTYFKLLKIDTWKRPIVNLG